MIWHLLVRLRRALGRAAVLLALLLGSVSAAAFASTGAPETLVFDDVVGPGNPDVSGLEIGPWFLASQKFHTVSGWDIGELDYADNGTAYIATVGGGFGHPITLERGDGSPFSLVAFDAAEGFLDDIIADQRGYISAANLEVEATLSSGFTVTLEFDLDRLRDGPDGVDDFETLTMPDDLRSVTSVTFTGLNAVRRDAGFALDNIVVAAIVPEPAAATLLIAGGAVLVASSLSAARRRRRRIEDGGWRMEGKNRR